MTRRTKQRMAWSVSIMLGAVLLLGFVSLVPYNTVNNWVCPVSGSTKRTITWFGNFSYEERTVSALELWLKRREPSFHPQWQSTSTQTYYVGARSCATGGMPEICRLMPIIDQAVEMVGDERIASLVAVLRHGSRDEQRQVIQSIADEVFDTE